MTPNRRPAFRIEEEVRSGIDYGTENAAITTAEKEVKTHGGTRTIWKLIAVVSATSTVEKLP